MNKLREFWIHKNDKIILCAREEFFKGHGMMTETIHAVEVPEGSAVISFEQLVKAWTISCYTPLYDNYYSLQKLAEELGVKQI